MAAAFADCSRPADGHAWLGGDDTAAAVTGFPSGGGGAERSDPGRSSQLGQLPSNFEGSHAVLIPWRGPPSAADRKAPACKAGGSEMA